MNNNEEIKEKNRMIKYLKSLLEKEKNENQRLENTTKFLKEHAQRAGTEMFEWKKEAVKLQQEVQKLKNEFEQFKLRTLAKLKEAEDCEKTKKVKQNGKSKSKSTKNTRRTK